ncbi:ATP-binding protein [Candidatus Woesearchaeota archaeon]|nr:ATP-binding protein [Candidatus Woesearchaeota archaeon]
MSYDIPPPLQHKEKIIFGLTFSQLAYALPAFLLIFLVIFKTPLSIEVSGTISVLVAFAAAFFMFFDGLARVRNWISYLRNPQVEVLSKLLKQIVDIKKIEKDTVHQSKSKLAVLEVIPMNFMLKTEEEKTSILVNFQKFLNGLDFPVQIHISSNPITLTEHFKHVDGKFKEKIAEISQKKPIDEKERVSQAAEISYLNGLVNSYCDFVRKSIEKNGIQNRKFHIIIRERDDIGMQARICTENLANLGLKVKRLNDEEIGTMFFSYIANKKQKEPGEDVTDVAHFLLSPGKVSFHPDYFTTDDQFCKVITVTGYPHSVEMGFLDKIISSGDKYDIVIHIEPYPIEFTMVELNRDLQKQQADLYADSKKGILNPSLEIKFNSTKKVLEDLQKGKQKLFDVSLYVMCKGKDKKEVDLLAKRIKASLDGLMIQNRVPMFQMIDSYASMLPLANNPLRIKRNVHTEGLAAFFPFSSPFLDIHNDGVLLGLNKNKIPYIKDIFRLANANGLILATSGSGKSYFTKLLLSRQFMNGCDVIIIDPQGEYLAITEHYKGECITISKDSKTMINPLDLMGHEYIEKRLSLMDLFYIMFRDINELQKSILDKAVDMTYENRGITRDDYESHVPPTMSELFDMLQRLEKGTVQQEKVTYRALLNRIQMYTTKGVFGFLDRQTQINFDNRFVCFNIGSLPKQVKPVMMYLILDYVFMRMKGSQRRKLLVIDEAWSMLQTAEESSYIFEIVKTCRKYNLGLLMITQDVADLVSSRAGHAVLANSSYTFLLRQKPAIISNVVKTFNLSQAERDFLVSATLGSGILILENEHQELEVIASPEEHKLITTNPDELIRMTEQKEPKESPTKKESEKADLDLTRLVFPAKGLTILQQTILNNHEYVMKKGHGLTSGPHTYYVKQRHPESLEHSLLVGLCLEEIRKYTDKVATYQTRQPDIIFENKIGQKIALEIETGLEFSKHQDRLEQKFEELRRTMPNRCYIVLTDKKVRNRYYRFGLPVMFREDITKFVTLQFSGQSNLNIGKALKVTSS